MSFAMARDIRRAGGYGSCRKIARLMDRYVDGELPPEVAAKVAVHLEHCKICGLDHATYLKIKAAVAAAGTDPAGPFGPDDAATIDADVLARLHAVADQIARGEGAEPPDPTGPPD